MRNAGLDEAQPGIKIAGRNISNLRYAYDNPEVRREGRTPVFLPGESQRQGSLVGLTFAIRVVSSAYLRLLIFLLAILIPACAPGSPEGYTEGPGTASSEPLLPS